MFVECQISAARKEAEPLCGPHVAGWSISATSWGILNIGGSSAGVSSLRRQSTRHQVCLQFFLNLWVPLGATQESSSLLSGVRRENVDFMSLGEWKERGGWWMGQDVTEHYRNAQEQYPILHEKDWSEDIVLFFIFLLLFHSSFSFTSPFYFSFFFLCLFSLVLAGILHFTFQKPFNISGIERKVREKYVEVQNKFGLKRRVEIKEMTSKVFHSLSWLSPALKLNVNQALALWKYCLGA